MSRKTGDSDTNPMKSDTNPMKSDSNPIIRQERVQSLFGILKGTESIFAFEFIGMVGGTGFWKLLELFVENQHGSVCLA